jgi:hypothetical protein
VAVTPLLGHRRPANDLAPPFQKLSHVAGAQSVTVWEPHDGNWLNWLNWLGIKEPCAS